MGFLQSLFGIRDPAAQEMQQKVEIKLTPFQSLTAAILRAAHQSSEGMKPSFPKAKTKREAIECRMRVFYEFLYFFMHMTNRSAQSEDFTWNQLEELQQNVFHDVIATAIDSNWLHLPEEHKAKMRHEFRERATFAEMEYSTSKELLSKENKPLTCHSLLAKLSRNVAEILDASYNPVFLFEVTLIAHDELMKSNIRKLVAGTKAVLNT